MANREVADKARAHAARLRRLARGHDDIREYSWLVSTATLLEEVADALTPTAREAA